MRCTTDDELFNIVRTSYHEANKDYVLEQATKACEYCANNPKNGGNGICLCILGTSVIY